MSTPRQYMPKALKAAWLAALRSGDYPQTTGLCYRSPEDAEVLYSAENGGNIRSGFCCLGVLMKIAGEPLEAIKGLGLPPAGWHTKHDIVSCSGGLRLNFVLGSLNASALNDSGRPFTKIADLIEKYVEGV